YILFFSRSRPHRDLHSFPTRRSSDLEQLAEQVAEIGGDGQVARFVETALLQAGPTAPDFAPAHAAAHHERDAGVAVIGPAVAVRSEEHTSELQSLAYLVCRLLLEKKK